MTVAIAKSSGAIGWILSIFVLTLASWVWARWPVVINEIHYDPDLKTELVEFVELYNAGTQPIEVADWRICGGIDYRFPSGSILLPGGFIVVAQDPDAVTRKWPYLLSIELSSGRQIVFGPFQGRLSNEGEQIVLCDADCYVVDTVAYQLGFPWPTVGDAVPRGSVGTGHSIQLMNPVFDNGLGGNWRSAAPSPGIQNTVIFTDNPPPDIEMVCHNPIGPMSGQTVVITARINDADGIDKVMLYYQLVDPGNYIPVTLPNPGKVFPNETKPNPEYGQNWVGLQMRDDGLFGDAVAADGLYTAMMPADLQRHRRLVRYRIQAQDRTGRMVTAPYPDDPQPNFAYFVYDGVPAWPGVIQPASPDPQKAKVVVYDSQVLTSLPVYHLIARQIDVSNCQYNPSYFNANDPQFYFSGTLVYEGQVYDNIHFRTRGTFSTFRWGKNKWKIDFNTGHWFQGSDDYGRPYAEKVDKINLGTGTCPWWKYPHPNGTWDRGTGGMMLNEPLGYRLYQMAGVPASNTHFIHLRVIDRQLEADPKDQYTGDFWGLYFVVEQVDGNFLQEHGLPDGNIYRMEGSINQNHQCQTQVSDQSDVRQFISAFQSRPSKSWWEQNFNLWCYYSSKAIGVCINDSDRRVNYNCLYYRDSSTGLWWYLPWDLDLSFEVGGHYAESSWEAFHYALDDYQQYAIEYRNRARELQDLLLNKDQAWQLIDEMAALIYDPNAGPTFMDAERARWDYCPLVSAGSRGLFYENNEFLKEKSFAGVLAYMKQFILPESFGYPYGGKNLDLQAYDPDIPYTPRIQYSGEPGFPTNVLFFTTGAFVDPQGSNTFRAMQWRIAQVQRFSRDTNGRVIPGRYEIQPVWQSQPSTTFNSRIQIPAGVVEPGLTYRVRCRMQDTTGRWSHWSDPIQFVAGPQLAGRSRLPLQVTEVMYHPAALDDGWDPDECEFIELTNYGSVHIDISGVSITGAVNFRFADGAIRQLAPGQSVIVVENAVAFECRYGKAALASVAGQYKGRLSNSSDRIKVIDFNSGVLADFQYSDKWYRSTDGKGFSLVLVDPRIDPGFLGLASSWQPSSRPGGSPGGPNGP